MQNCVAYHPMPIRFCTINLQNVLVRFSDLRFVNVKELLQSDLPLHPSSFEELVCLLLVTHKWLIL